jgi:hypothetical protein
MSLGFTFFAHTLGATGAEMQFASKLSSSSKLGGLPQK